MFDMNRSVASFKTGFTENLFVSSIFAQEKKHFRVSVNKCVSLYSSVLSEDNRLKLPVDVSHSLQFV